MGIFSCLRKGIKSKANAAVDSMVDPEKELDMVILELEEERKKAIKELISYKATAKQMEQEITRYQERSESWEKKAMGAVNVGDDELAKKALAEKKRCETEIGKIRADRDEAAGYAIELNRSRKKFDVKLKMLKLRKGTMATQIAAQRSGGESVFSTDNATFEKLRRAEEKIDDEAIQAEVDAAMKGDDLASTGSLGGSELEAAGLLPAARDVDAELALAELKAKFERDKGGK